ERMKIKFSKMQGLGNDFIFIDGRSVKIPNLQKLAPTLCDRRFGVGADQILVLGKSSKADFKMDIYNSDGSRVEMCGNGLRALARFVMDRKLTSKKEIRVETASGIQGAKIFGK